MHTVAEWEERLGCTEEEANKNGIDLRAVVTRLNRIESGPLSIDRFSRHVRKELQDNCKLGDASLAYSLAALCYIARSGSIDLWLFVCGKLQRCNQPHATVMTRFIRAYLIETNPVRSVFWNRTDQAMPVMAIYKWAANFGDQSLEGINFAQILEDLRPRSNPHNNGAHYVRLLQIIGPHAGLSKSQIEQLVR